MEVEKEKIDQRPTAKGPQDKEVGGRSGTKGEYDEERVVQKGEPTGQKATQLVPGIPKPGGAHGDSHSKANPDIDPPRVNTGAQSILEQVLEHTHQFAPIPSYLQSLSIIERKNDPLTTCFARDQELSLYKARVTGQEKELKATNARFEILQQHFSFLREELQGFYHENPAEVFEEVRERLKDIAAAVRTSPAGCEVLDRNFSVKGGKPSRAEPSKLVFFTNFPKRRVDFSPENSPVKADKANLSVFGRFARFTSFLKIFRRGESSSQSNLPSAESNNDTTGPTNPLNLSAEKFDLGDTRQAPEVIGTTTALRELARKSLRQHSLILSKLNRQQPLIPSSSSSHPSPVSTFVPPTKNRVTYNIPLIFLYTANIVLFLIFLVTIAWALATGFMADSERRMWLAGGETARMVSALLEHEGGFWEKGWGPGAGGWGLGGDVESLRRGYFW